MKYKVKHIYYVLYQLNSPVDIRDNLIPTKYFKGWKEEANYQWDKDDDQWTENIKEAKQFEQGGIALETSKLLNAGVETNDHPYIDCEQKIEYKYRDSVTGELSDILEETK